MKKPLNQPANSGIETTIMFLGPYRNLTTLTAAVFGLHPEIVVLNHAGDRIFDDSDKNFLTNYSDQRYANFIEFALQESAGGKRGTYGGAISKSHAFDHDEMVKAHAEMQDNKTTPKTLVWKESLKVYDIFDQDESRLDNLLANNSDIRFIMPVRNTLDVATSSINKGNYYKMFPGQPTDVVELSKRIIDVYKRVLAFQQKSPDRIMLFFENDFGSDLLDKLQDYARVTPSKTWKQEAEKTINISSNYSYTESQVTEVADYAKQNLGDRPDFLQKLLAQISG